MNGINPGGVPRNAVFFRAFSLFLLLFFSGSFAAEASASAPFVENNGRYPDEVYFYASGPGGTLFFTDNGIIVDRITGTSGFSLPRERGRMPVDSAAVADGILERHAFRIDFPGSSMDVLPAGIDRGPAQIRYMTGTDGGSSSRGAAMYGQVLYRDLYPGIDLLYERTSAGHLKYDLLVAPGADLSQVVFRYEGISDLSINGAGELVLHGPAGEMLETSPQVWQEYDDHDTSRKGRYRILGPNLLGFEVEETDPSAAIVFDPGLLWSTLIGGGSLESALTSAVESDGNIIIAGYTLSDDYPTTMGAYQTTLASLADVFVSRLDPTGSELLASTFIGGADFEAAQALVLDDTGAILLAGMTRSSDFPITSSAFDGEANGSQDVFLLKLDARLDSIHFSTYLGGSNFDEAIALKTTHAGEVLVAGRTFSALYQTTAGAFDLDYNGFGDGFVSKLDGTGSQLMFSTFIGGNLGDRIWGMETDEAGSIYLTGLTRSSTFPVTAGAFDTTPDDSSDAFLVKLSADGAQLEFSTLLGGRDDDEGISVVVDPAGPVYVCGTTKSNNFPVTPGAFQTTIGRDSDAFIAQFDATGSTLTACTYQGGFLADFGWRLGLLPTGEVVLGGHTLSTDFPVTANAWDPDFNGGTYDLFLTRFSADLADAGHSTYLGGSIDEYCWDFCLNAAGDVILSGETNSSDFPLTTGAYDTTLNGTFVTDAYVLSFDISSSQATAVVEGLPGRSARFTASPNPFNPTSTIRYSLADPARVTIDIYNHAGQLVRSLLDRPDIGGEHSVLWDGRLGSGRQAPSGTYFIRLRVDEDRHFQKVVLIR